MKKYWKLGLAGGFFLLFVFVTLARESAPGFIEMEVKGVRLDLIGQSPVVLLSDKEGKRLFPIWIGFPEANAIDKELRHLTSTRPMTHDLLHSILGQIKVKLKEVKVVDLKDNTYYATLSLISNKNLIEVDARPSDAIILALKSKCPIYVSAKILEEKGVALTQPPAHSERYGIRVQELTPSLASHFNYKGQKGVLVSEVSGGSPSELSGIKAGDIISKVNLKEVGSIQQFEKAIDETKGSSSIKILIFRDGKFQEIQLSLRP